MNRELPFACECGGRFDLRAPDEQNVELVHSLPACTAFHHLSALDYVRTQRTRLQAIHGLRSRPSRAVA